MSDHAARLKEIARLAGCTLATHNALALVETARHIEELTAALDGMVRCFDPAALSFPPESTFVRTRLETARALVSPRQEQEGVNAP